MSASNDSRGRIAKMLVEDEVERLEAQVRGFDEAFKARTDELYLAYERIKELQKSLEYERQNADEWNESANDSEADSEKWKNVALAIYEHIEDTNEGTCPVIREYALVLGKVPVGEDDLAMDELMEGLDGQDHLEAHPWNIQEDR